VGIDSDNAKLLVVSGEGGGDSELNVVGVEGVRGDELLLARVSAATSSLATSVLDPSFSLHFTECITK
jgi:hypothetical protein